MSVSILSHFQDQIQWDGGMSAKPFAALAANLHV